MFRDLFEGSAESVDQSQLSSAFDAEQLSEYLKESEQSIDSLIESYRILMTQALQESAGSISGDAILVMENANEHVGNKIVNALKRLWQWISQVVDSAINFISTMVASNKSFVQKVRPEVEKKLKAEDMNKIRMNSYDYKPDLIVIDNIKPILSEIEAEARSEYNKQNSEKLDGVVQQYKEQRRKAQAFEKITFAKRLVKGNVNENEDWGKFKDEVRLAMMGGGEKRVKTFSMDYFKVIENYANNANAIKSAMQSTKQEFKKIIDSVIQRVGETKKQDKDEDAKFISGKIAYLNYLRSKTSVVADAFAEMLSLKLNILKRQLSEARAFCMYAARYKPVQEADAPIIPFDPLFENADEDDQDVEDGGDDSLKESTVVF